jgi:hypothetical protein
LRQRAELEIETIQQREGRWVLTTSRARELSQMRRRSRPADQERQHDVVALGLSGHTPTRPESAGKEYVIPLSEFSPPLPRMPDPTVLTAELGAGTAQVVGAEVLDPDLFR